MKNLIVDTKNIICYKMININYKNKRRNNKGVPKNDKKNNRQHRIRQPNLQRRLPTNHTKNDTTRIQS